ncbi:hypothetical protein NC652_007687 [Populus alba x Populus x berolinensis]|nr:hypothetical protein NC652_007687 [Populus alba x Populus x berolinensis]
MLFCPLEALPFPLAMISPVPQRQRYQLEERPLSLQI